ncbi:MAG TPA: putative Ig domain-containing protein, partial [Rhodopila sp.]|nr:putative Ig domain-containing protein [Rhodopila sp.]
MSINDSQTSFIDATSVSMAVAQMFSVTASPGNPTYLIVSALDRNEYTAGATGATGSFVGNGQTLALTDVESDGRGAGILFTYQPYTGRYYNPTYGYFDQLQYVPSSSPGDVTNISVYGTNTLYGLQSWIGDPWAWIYLAAQYYIGSATVVTQPNDTGPVPAQATPDSIASTAESFVGQAWNMNGCWVLASTIAADAGASLPVQSTAIGIPGVANGEWMVAFNGPAGQSGDWQSMVHAGDMVVFLTAGGTGHITTCVAGSGTTAQLVDNITYVDASGAIQNSANDGSPNDVIIAAPHAASQEFDGVSASSVVIYQLDTPLVTTAAAAEALPLLGSLSLGSVFSATDPAQKTITDWQVFNTAATDALSVGGVIYNDHTAETALTEASLSNVSLMAGSAITTDTVEVRAFNGTYWGDWQTLAVTIASAATAPPVLARQTATQTWVAGSSIDLALPAGTFTDPQNLPLTYRATRVNGQALPSWLKFNAQTDTFTGTAPTTATTIGITVTATDSNNQSVSETFYGSVIAPPTVTAATANQVWNAGKPFSLTLASNTFTDPQAETMTYTATLSNGQPLPSWLTFNAATRTFSGTAPSSAQTISVAVTATDTSGLSVTETFNASVQATRPVISVSNPTPDQTWTDGQTVNLSLLASKTFTDGLGLPMRFLAFELSGPDVRSWLHFNPATADLFGTVPTNATGTVKLDVIAWDRRGLVAADPFNVT